MYVCSCKCAATRTTDILECGHWMKRELWDWGGNKHLIYQWNVKQFPNPKLIRSHSMFYPHRPSKLFSEHLSKNWNQHWDLCPLIKIDPLLFNSVKRQTSEEVFTSVLRRNLDITVYHRQDPPRPKTQNTITGDRVVALFGQSPPDQSSLSINHWQLLACLITACWCLGTC